MCSSYFTDWRLGSVVRQLPREPCAAEAVPADGVHRHQQQDPVTDPGPGLHLRIRRSVPRTLYLREQEQEGGGKLIFFQWM